MTMAMSDRDYAVLVDAAQWVRAHSGTDAPEYPKLDKLCRVMEGIGKRRSSRADAVRPEEPRQRCADLVARVLDLRKRQLSPGQQAAIIGSPLHGDEQAR